MDVPDPLASAPDIAYLARGEVPGAVDVWGIQSDGSAPSPLVVDATRKSGLAWSPDGRRLAFVSAAEGRENRLEIVDADGTDRRVVDTERLGLAGVQGPAWSPDGQRLAFAASAPGTDHPYSAIYTITTAGDGLRRLTDNPRGDREPAWSPDGSRIAYTSMRPVDEYGQRSHITLYVMDADGSGKRSLLAGVPRSVLGPAWGGTDSPVGNPAWSPDGREIAVMAGHDAIPVVIALDLASSSLRRVTPDSGINSDFAGGPPSWSPDGRRLAFVAPVGGVLHSIRADGSDLTRLATTGVSYAAPRYRPGANE